MGELKKKRVNKSQLSWQNAEIVRPNVMIRVQTPVPPPICVCEFIMVLSFRLPKKK